MEPKTGDGVAPLTTPETGTTPESTQGDVDFTNADAAKEAYQRVLDERKELADNNKQLYARAKKAEGFELVDGEWVKPPKVESKPSKKPSQPNELDWGQLAFHNSKTDAVKIEAAEDIEFLKQTMEETGKPMDAILGSKWFTSDLQERQAARRSANAIPKGNNRSGQTGITDVDLAVAKYKETGVLPDDFETRSKVIDKAILEPKKNNNALFAGK